MTGVNQASHHSSAKDVLPQTIETMYESEQNYSWSMVTIRTAIKRAGFPMAIKQVTLTSNL